MPIRRSFPGLLAVPLLWGIAACSSDSPPRSSATTRTDTPSPAQLVRSSAARDTPGDNAEADGAALATHVGAELYAPVADATKGPNVAYSPLSVTMALGMLRSGSAGKSATQLDAFLGAAPGDDVGAALNGLDRHLSGLAGVRATSDGGKGDVRVSNANALWGQRGVRFEAPFLDRLARSYGAGMRLVDYRSPEAARRTINAWVSDQTSAKIPELIPSGALTDRSRLTLTNALYFKAPWDGEFDERDGADFTRADGSTVRTPMMGTTREFPYAAGEGWQAVTVPYIGGETAMTLLVPDDGKLSAVEGGLDDKMLTDLASGASAAPREVALTLPPFDLDVRTTLTDILRELGVTAPFDGGADFDPISTDPAAQPLVVSEVRHQATVTVDEKGTEAAAATSVEMEVGSAPGDTAEPLTLTLDRPFLFVVHDTETGTPLFLGRVGDPTAS